MAWENSAHSLRSAKGQSYLCRSDDRVKDNPAASRRFLAWVIGLVGGTAEDGNGLLVHRGDAKAASGKARLSQTITPKASWVSGGARLISTRGHAIKSLSRCFCLRFRFWTTGAGAHLRTIDRPGRWTTEATPVLLSRPQRVFFPIVAARPPFRDTTANRDSTITSASAIMLRQPRLPPWHHSQ